MQKRLLAAARQLADATANMVDAAKGCASSPNDSEQQKRLRGASEDLRAATNIAASNALKKKLIRRLENAARRTASATTQLINASKNANKSNTNKTSEHQLTQQCQVLSAATVVAKHTSALCNACRLASSKTSNPVAKRHFVQSAKDVANSTANLVKAIKVLDQDFTEENRQRCAEAAKPLTDAVDELTTFASSPEFASMPAKISPEARKAQEPIVSAGKAMIDGACHMVTAAKQLAVNPKDPPIYQLYSNHSKSVSEAIKRLVSSIKDCAPGQRECDESIDKLNRSIRDLDQASLAAISQSLQQRTEKSLRGFQEQMIGSAREIHDLCSKVKDSAKAESENLGHRVTMMASYFGPLSDGAVGAALLIQNSKQQTHILDLTKTVAESALQFMYSCKEG
ncbi:talin-2-like [Magallana gigas]|uniref:talin-2-like n=1 Tax=Magallana gigas TaxID=29159 RepID=UPI003340ACBC